MKIVTRKEAKALGLKRYFTGKACIHGHVTERYVSDVKCVECNRQDAVNWRAANPNKVKQGKSRWARANPDKVVQRALRWDINNPGGRSRNTKRWRLSNPLKVRANSKNRRMRKRGAEGQHSADDIKNICAKQGNACFGCGVSFDFVKPTEDHIIALSKGGSNWPSNLQLLCQPCNDSKSVKDMSEWYPPWDINQYVIRR